VSIASGNQSSSIEARQYNHPERSARAALF
jgi:hypothetical protein